MKFILKVERKLNFPAPAWFWWKLFFSAGRTFFLLLLRALWSWASLGVASRIYFRSSDLLCGVRAAFRALAWKRLTAAEWSGAGKSEKKAVCLRACQCARVRAKREIEGARERAAFPRCWVPGCRRLRQHGLRVEEAGGPRGQQPREDLLHAEESASGDQDGHRVRVRAAGLQLGR